MVLPVLGAAEDEDGEPDPLEPVRLRAPPGAGRFFPTISQRGGLIESTGLAAT